MRERSKGEGLFLLLYNTTHLKVDYDRAIFFFDGRGSSWNMPSAERPFL